MEIVQNNGAATVLGEGNLKPTQTSATAYGENYVTVNSALPITPTTPTSRTPASPSAYTAGVSSGKAVNSNSSRKGLVLTNTSSNFISLGFGASAVLYSGITLAPYGIFNMNEYCFYTGDVYAIASAASSNLGIQEYS